MNQDDTIAEMLEQAPLVRFSVYSHLQVQVVQNLGTEVRTLLDAVFQGEMIDGSAFNLVYGRFWLWVLAAYEVTRTMSEYKSCFSERHNAEVAQFKRRISILRIPFAKLQLQGHKKQPMNGEASVYGIDRETRDLSFHVGETFESMRRLIEEFERLGNGIQPEDVLCDLRDDKSKS